LFSSYWAITKNSFIEIIRQPVYSILLVGGMVLIGLSPAVTMFSLVDDEKLMVDMGLATILILGLVMAVLSATCVITREIEAQTVGAIVSKPVGRFLFVVSKFSAVALAMGVAGYLLTVILLTSLRIGTPSTAHFKMDYPALIGELGPLFASIGLGIYVNYFYRWNFSSSAIVFALFFYTLAAGSLLIIGPHWQIEWLPEVFKERNAREVALACLLAVMGIWVLSSVAVALSTRLNVVLNSIVCIAVFFVGMIAQFIFSAEFWPPLVASVGLRLLPNLYVFWVADQLMMEAPYIPPEYVLSSALYMGAFCVSMVFFAGYLFERREVV
jgi:ABC-2 type transport system permease protein